MKNIFIAFLFLVFFAGFAPFTSAQSVLRIMQEHPRVVVYGDGLTEGNRLSPEQRFDQRLEARLKADGLDATVINMSEEGMLSVDALANLGAVIGKSPDVVILQIGETEALRRLSVDRLRENLREIISRLRNKGIYVVAMGTKAPPNSDADYTKEIERIFTGSHGFSEIVPLYPYPLEGIAGNDELTLSNGYHPNAGGVDVMVNAVYNMVREGLRWKQGVVSGQGSR
jgi:acyl-CoA thioesterase-1